MKRSLFRLVVVVSLTLNLLAAIGAFIITEKEGGLPWLRRKETEMLHPKQAARTRADYASTRLSIFAQLPIGTNDIVFLGDSILDFGEWHEFLRDSRAKNRGINGDDTHSMLNRLNQIVVGRPSHVVLLVGGCNIEERLPFEQTTNEYAQIVTTICAQSPRTTLWLLPLLAVNTDLYREWIVPSHPGIKVPNRTEVEALNAFMKELAVERPRVHFVDLPELLGRTGELRDDYTLDGVHLNGRGLNKLAMRLRHLGVVGPEDTASLAGEKTGETSEGRK